jgi:D-alanyl-D-alanine carboxypeptidase/D-alanyl-D-alanine-endopeptidase (penicillin-binding protein 4)
MHTFLLRLWIVPAFFLVSCSVQKKIGKSAIRNVIRDSSLRSAHVGISIFEPASGRYWYNYQGDKYFVPASNTKIPTCYAAMKYLGDSLPGLKVFDYGDHLYFKGTADPSFLHEDFKTHPVLEFLKSLEKPAFMMDGGTESPLGSGWAWNDYDQYYMAERSAFPLYGNIVKASGTKENLQVIPSYFKARFRETQSQGTRFVSSASRDLHHNQFTFQFNSEKETSATTTFLTSDSLAYSLLLDTLKKRNLVPPGIAPLPRSNNQEPVSYTIRSQPTDSVLKPMMHRSDNFFAEQTLLMVSHQMLGSMNDSRTIDSILKTDFRDLPQRPRWVDGSGLSRYNMFTPQGFVAILNKMKNEFGMERVKTIFPTGGEGTISSYYRSDSSFIYAKTGTLSGVVALSGFLYTAKGKLLLFSVLVNNHSGSATAVRKAVEKFLQGVRREY